MLFWALSSLLSRRVFCIWLLVLHHLMEEGPLRVALLRVVGCARRRLPEWKLPAGEPHTCLCVATAVPEDMRGDTSPSGGPSPSVLPDPRVQEGCGL